MLQLYKLSVVRSDPVRTRWFTFRFVTSYHSYQLFIRGGVDIVIGKCLINVA